jgi:N-acetylglucosaminyl-diphospho-decaprenol L-rhamnosyltransferase
MMPESRRESRPDLSIVIVNWNTSQLLRQCLSSIKNCGENWEIVVVDNASTDDSSRMVEDEFPEAHLLLNETNLGFARANNRGIQASRGRYILLLNSDTVASEEALAYLVSFMDQHPNVGACGPRLLRLDGSPQPYAFGGDPTLFYLLARGINQLLFRRYLHDWATHTIQEVDWVSGACLMARRQAIEQVGLLDENIFMYFEDNDWCLRIRKAGWKVYYNPQVSIVHIGGQSLAQNPSARQAYYHSLNYFYAKHYSPFARLLLQLGLLPYRLLVKH